MGILLHLFHRKKKASSMSELHLGKRSVMTRRHLPGSLYALPKDVTEEQRIDFQHYVLYQLLGSHYSAPINQNIDSILDMGSGTGRWSIDMARLFPHAQVIGMDKEAPFDSALDPPPNYRFLQGNVLTDLPFVDERFAYVHQRLLVGAIPATRWPFVLRELVRVTQRGGYIELVEGGNHYLHAGPATSQIVQWGTIASQRVGIDASLMTNLDTMMSNAGVQDVSLTVLQAPVGKWGGRIGALLLKDMHAALAGLEDFYCQILGISSEQFHTVLKELPDEWEQQKTSYEFYIVYGQRPMTD